MDKFFEALRTVSRPKTQLYTTYYFENNIGSHFHLDLYLKKPSFRAFTWYRTTSALTCDKTQKYLSVTVSSETQINPHQGSQCF
jgi:hypothetical protein